MTTAPAAPATFDACAVDLSHDWIVAAMIRVPANVAKSANFRGSFRVKVDTRVDALETYCERCKRPLDEAWDTVCAAKVNNEHLIGGNQAVRAKRKVVTLPPNAVLLPGRRIHRFGMDGYLSGESR